MKKYLLLLGALLPFTAGAAAPALHTKCGSRETPRHYLYCVTTTEGSKNQDLLYVLHGGGAEDANWWSRDEDLGQVRELWSARGYEAPRVVEVSFGPIWILSEKNKGPKSGLLEELTQKVMPYLEKHVLKGSVGARRAFGHSMGGLNGAILAMKAPRLFKSVLMLAPAFMEVSPFAKQEEFARYAAELGKPITEEIVEKTVKLALPYVGSEADWQKLSPSIAGARELSAQSPEMLILAGEKDPLFYPAAKAFAKSLEGTGAKVSFVSLGTDHWSFDRDLVADFLMK